MSATPTGRRQRKAATRETLKEAARRCFGERGYERTGIAEIARGAGVAHGTFYVHFADKNELLDEMLAEFNVAFAQRLQPVLAAAADGPIAAIARRVAAAFLDHWKEHRGFVESYARRSAAGMTLASLRDGLNPPMVDLLGHALAARMPGRPAAEIDLVTQALLSMWLRVGLQYLFGKGVSRALAVDTLVRLSVGAIEGVGTATASAPTTKPAKGAKGVRA